MGAGLTEVLGDDARRSRGGAQRLCTQSLVPPFVVLGGTVVATRSSRPEVVRDAARMMADFVARYG